ncbi:MAG: lipid-A-disaccharide synthase [Flavobacteriales bacterium]|nr:lipid-A-disaccharide synthase [Flavobacteriales bacterium]
MKYYIIAGEASGDLHGKNLMHRLKEYDQSAEFRVWGGDKMKPIADSLVMHYKDIAFMGFIEVLKNLSKIMKAIRFCKEDILKYKPDALILIDYPGFNLRIAEFAHENNLKVYYYISPQIWAWKKSRVHKIKRFVHKMYVILPFEKKFYAKYDYEVEYVGHPLLDEIKPVKETEKKNIVALLPGSRKQEIRRILPEMLNVRKTLPNTTFLVSKAPSIDVDFYTSFGLSESEIYEGSSYDLMNMAKAALVTSGTATLETAIHLVPQVVCYKANTLSYFLARLLIKVDYISLVNLIMEKEVVKELIQFECNKKNLEQELNALLEPQNRQNMLRSYTELIEILGNSGASDRVAKSIFNTIVS